MRANKLIAGAAGVLLYAAAGAAGAATVTFSNFNDDGSPALFDISQNVISGNTIELGRNNFEADGASIATQQANDTMTFTITADPGQVITSVSYVENGNGATGEGVAIATGSLVADGQPANFLTQIFAPNTPEQGWTIGPLTIDIDNKQQISVSVTNSLFALSLGGPARIEKSFSELTVTTVPLPPAFGMLGAALVGLATVGMRRRA